ncbi:MAG: hypothetical protein ACRDQY_24465 [Pseudonocardiaceae bacterium]
MQDTTTKGNDRDGTQGNALLPRRFRSSARWRTPAVRVGLPTSMGPPQAMHAGQRTGGAFGQFQYPTLPLCVSSDFRTRTLRRHLDTAVTEALQAQETRV